MTPAISVIAGLLVIGSLIMALVRLFACTHSWEFVDKTEFPPPIEAAKKNGVSVGYMWDSDIKEMSKKTVVIVIRCPKCGEAKILRETH